MATCPVLLNAVHELASFELLSKFLMSSDHSVQREAAAGKVEAYRGEVERTRGELASERARFEETLQAERGAAAAKVEGFQRELSEAVAWSERRDREERAAAEAEVARLRASCEERVGRGMEVFGVGQIEYVSTNHFVTK